MPDLDGLAPPPQPLHASRKSPTGYFGLLYKGMLQARVVLKAGAFFFCWHPYRSTCTAAAARFSPSEGAHRLLARPRPGALLRLPSQPGSS
jgi:hypothetical protein